MTADDERAEFIECGEGEIARLRTDGCSAIGLDEVDDPVAAMVEVHQDNGHGLVFSSGGGAADATLNSAMLGMVAVLACEHVAGKAKEDFAGTITPKFSTLGHFTAMLSRGKDWTSVGMGRAQPLQVTTQFVGLGPVCWV
jgi:hypothetical protein